ncbi:MAG TPA: NnrU family protein [Steroidobacteraceae bacterium]|nr:NnrU family protein [Steroidobacteraceae bacterium]
MAYLVVGLLLFLGVHSIGIFAPAWRDATAARLGDATWKALFGFASIIGFVMLVHGYALARQDPQVLYATPLWMRHVTALLMLPVFPLLLATYLPGRIKTAVKHPTLTATKTWALAHLLANGAVADVLLFGGFLAWAVADRIAVGKRPVPRRTPGAPPSRWNDLVAVVAGLALYALFVGWAHERLIGIPAMLPPH